MNADDQTAAEVPDHVADYLNQEKTVTLATSTGDTPHACTLVYVNDGPLLYVWVRASTATARNVEQNPTVGFAIDEYTQDLRQTKGIQGTGECQAVTDGDELARVGELFGQKFPDLRPGASGAVSFFRIRPRELFFIDNAAGDEAPAPDEYRRQSVFE
jgi:uncharacterized protein YhbP (UPF0306 family)